MIRIKICGITNADEAAHAVASGADAIGLNFFEHSSRYVEPANARQIAAALPESATKIGVFVNASVARIGEVLGEVQLDAIQLHGDEPPELLAQLPSTQRIVSVYRCDARGLAPWLKFLESCRAAGREPDALLIDAAAVLKDEYGGTGRKADWELIARERTLIGNIPLILAGGLTPENVADAIRAARPDGVDVASGVESAPGKKDAAKVRDFIAAAKDAFAGGLS